MTLDAAYPIALLPVRLEARFASPTLLQVRIFPDDIWADTHEPELTDQELADGNAYLAAKAAGLAAEQAAWGVLVSRWTAPRAAWIAHAAAAGSPRRGRKAGPGRRRRCCPPSGWCAPTRDCASSRSPAAPCTRRSR